jgi:hypothetical protein
MLTLQQAGRLVLLILMLGFWFALAGCTGTDSVRPAETAAASDPMRNPSATAVSGPDLYAPSIDWRAYNRAIVDPVAIYRGPDQQFGDMAEADKKSLAGYMRSQLAEKLRSRFRLVSDPGPHTLRLRLTLTGADTKTPAPSAWLQGYATTNSLPALSGDQRAIAGSVSYVVEILDAATSRLLSVFVTKQYPGPYKLGASTRLPARSGIEIGNG